MKEIIDIVHKSILPFFDVCENEEEPLSDKDKLLLKVNKAICNNLKALEKKQKTGHWRHYENMLICSECGAEFYDDIMEYCGDDVPKCCPNCGAKMESEGK